MSGKDRIRSRPVTIDGVNVTYDALGRMVEQSSGGSYTEIVYDPTGAKLALMNGQSLQKAFVSLAGGSMAVYNSSGLAYYRHSDWLGSSRFASTPTRGMYSDTAYGPYGEAYAQSGTTDVSFTGMNQDTVLNLYDFPAREYGIQGRWPSPDPAGLAAVDLSDPQTLNRYAYVRNSPLEAVDPLGLMCNLVDPDGGTSCGGGGVEFDLSFGGGGGPVGFPGLPRINLKPTPPTFPTGPGIDWISVLFGPPDPSLLILNGFCVDITGHRLKACTPGLAVAWCPGEDESSCGLDKIWWRTFWGTFVGNFFSRKFYKKEFAPGGCLAVAKESAENADVLGFIPSSGVSAENTIQAASATLAARYAARQGLSVPLRSSLVQGTLAAGETTAATFTASYFLYVTAPGVVAEGRAIAQGTCH